MSGFLNKLERIGEKSYLGAKVISQVEYLLLPATKSANKRIDDIIQFYVPEEQRKNKKYIRHIKKDMLYSRLAYQTSLAQYFIFGFEKLNRVGRKDFVGDHEKGKYTDALHSTSDVYLTFRNKYNCYEAFKPYYRREVIEMKGFEDKETFLAFARKHPRFILKIEDEALGNGVRLVDLEKDGKNAEELFEQLMTEGKIYIAEEVIQQSAEMMALHPSSVNTVRFVTYLKGDEVMHLFSFLRMGSGGGIIDNATSGGIAAAIDLKTGIVTTPGWREDLTQYLRHPDTGVQIIGMQVPRWDELLKLVDELARVVPEQKYVGWDLALTDDGWVVVEGNDAAMMTAIQMCERKGLRSVFDAAFKDQRE